MTPIFADGQKVRFSDYITALAPAYAGQTFTVLAATAQWEIGRRNEWCGDYVIQSESGEKSITSESCLVAM